MAMLPAGGLLRGSPTAYARPEHAEAVAARRNGDDGGDRPHRLNLPVFPRLASSMSATPHHAAPANPSAPESAAPAKQDFIRQIVREDLASGKHQAIRTRFP